MIDKEEKPVLHLMVNNTCTNDCPLCCNKQYDVDKIPVVTVEELKSVETICYTGGQPLLWMYPFVMLCNRIKKSYPNIKKEFVYINGDEIRRMGTQDLASLAGWNIDKHSNLISGLTMSPKCQNDWDGLKKLNEEAPDIFPWLLGKKIISAFKSNRIYCFSENDVVRAKEIFPNGNVEIVRREWQKEFKPAPNTIFRRLPIWIS